MVVPPGKARQQFYGVISRVGIIRRGHDAVVAILPPAVKRRAVVIAGLLAVAQSPPNQPVEFRLHDIAEAVGEKQAVDQAGRLLAGIVGDGIVLRGDKLHSRARRPQVIGQLLAKTGRGGFPALRRLQQIGVAFVAGFLLIAVVDDEVRRDVERFQRRQHYRRPTVVGNASARVGRRMVGVIGIGIFAVNHHHADFDGRVNGLHLGDIVLGPQGVGVRVVRPGLRVILPSAIVLVANFPVFEAVVFRDVGITDPSGRLLRCAAAVVDGDEGLPACLLGDAGKGVKIAGPLKIVAVAGVGLPMVAVRRRTAGEAQDFAVGRLQQGNGCRGIQRRVPCCRIDAEPAVVHHAHDLVRIDAEVDVGGRRLGQQSDVVHIKRRLGATAAGLLQPESGHIAGIGDAQGGEGNAD